MSEGYKYQVYAAAQINVDVPGTADGSGWEKRLREASQNENDNVQHIYSKLAFAFFKMFLKEAQRLAHPKLSF